MHGCVHEVENDCMHPPETKKVVIRLETQFCKGDSKFQLLTSETYMNFVVNFGKTQAYVVKGATL